MWSCFCRDGSNALRELFRVEFGLRDVLAVRAKYQYSEKKNISKHILRPHNCESRNGRMEVIRASNKSLNTCNLSRWIKINATSKIRAISAESTSKTKTGSRSADKNKTTAHIQYKTTISCEAFSMCSAIITERTGRRTKKKRHAVWVSLARSFAAQATRPKKLNRMRLNTQSHLAQEDKNHRNKHRALRKTPHNTFHHHTQISHCPKEQFPYTIP